ncbi:MAG TPA: acetyl-CoA carboxylase biotin carboxyl carrier protein subunit [Bacteroidia bacterium]|nr:acetyl-CoA carboxylase biotin carboxyl carrier protein subunit [Bacteroidia bacterium]
MKATVNNKDYTITEKAKEPLTYDVNGKSLVLDVYEPRKGVLHIIYNARSYNAEFISYNEDDKVVTLKVNNSRYEVKLKDETDELLERLGIGAKQHKVMHIKAPMPGLVIEIKVKPGDMVNKGDALLVLEAMKMENIIKAQAQAVVKKVHATKGTAVEKNQVLIEME